MPLGGLTADGSWKDVQTPEELIGGENIADRFRDLYVAGLLRLAKSGELTLPADVSRLAANPEQALAQWLAPVATKSWVVNIQSPPADCIGAEAALKYLAAYVGGSPISNSRIVAMTDDSVSFTWKDYRDGAKRKVETVSGDEFVRRFLIHILPKGFQRIRHYGFLASNCQLLCSEFLF